MVILNKIAKSFGKNEVLKDTSLNLNKSGIYSILGPNGSGKTTMIKILLGMVNPDKGDILFKGERVNGLDKYRKDISYLPQIASFPENLTVDELFTFIEKLRGEPDFKQELIDLFEVEEYRNKTLRNLSGGTRQKVNLISCLMYNTELIILDEPSVGLDPISLLKLKDLVLAEKEKGKIILITTHIMKLVDDLSDQIIFLLDGKIHFSGTKEEMLKNTESNDMEHAMASILTNKKAKNV